MPVVETVVNIYMINKKTFFFFTLGVKNNSYINASDNIRECIGASVKIPVFLYKLNPNVASRWHLKNNPKTPFTYLVVPHDISMEKLGEKTGTISEKNHTIVDKVETIKTIEENFL